MTLETHKKSYKELHINKRLPMIIVEGIDHINIAVKDLEDSSKFYTDIFDFEIIEDSNKKFILMSMDPIKIKLIKVDNYENNLSQIQIPAISFGMDEDDFTEAIEELEEKKIKIVRGPESIENGESLIFADPDNNLIEIYYKE